MIKVTREEPAEPLVTITTTKYGAEYIAYCLRCYVRNNEGLRQDVKAATIRAATKIDPRAATEIDPYVFNYNTDKISKLFQ